MVKQSRSNYQVFQEASLSQKLSDKDPMFREISGANPEIANAIGIFIVLGQHGLIGMDAEKAKQGYFVFTDPNISLIVDILRMNLKVSFATSEKTNEITKMGFRMPKAEFEISSFGTKE